MHNQFQDSISNFIDHSTMTISFEQANSSRIEKRKKGERRNEEMSKGGGKKWKKRIVFSL